MRDSLVQDLLMATLSALFGILALTVAAVGLAGLVGYSINRRRGEIGIRAALGAAPGSLVWLVMRDVAVLTGIGLALGIAGSAGVTRYVGAMLYGLSPTDPLTMAIAGSRSPSSLSWQVTFQRAVLRESIPSTAYGRSSRTRQPVYLDEAG